MTTPASSHGDSEPSRGTHPSASKRIEQALLARRITFQFEPNFRLESIREVEGTQVRLTEHRAPKEMVKRFAEQMRTGAIFPAIVVNERGELVDGNTRCAAASRIRRKTVAAYICSELSPLEARSLSVELNQSHGLSMTDDELRTFVQGAVREGQSLDTRAYARMTGVAASTLSCWVAGAQFRVRAERCGITPAQVALLSETARAALQVARLRSVFEETTGLAVAARVPAAQLKRLIAAANKAPSEAEALRIVALERQARADDIEMIASGFRAVSRRNRYLAMHVKALLAYDIETILDVAPGAYRDTFDSLCALQRHVDATVAAAARRWGHVSVR